MRKIKGLFIGLFLFCYFPLSADEGAIAYNDFLICWQDYLEESILILGDKIDLGNKAEAETALHATQDLIVEAQITIKEKIPFNSEFAYQEAALEWWGFYEQIFDYDYPEILKISFASNLEDKNLKRLKGFLLNIRVAEKFANYEFKVAQKRFALKYNLHLE